MKVFENSPPAKGCHGGLSDLREEVTTTINSPNDTLREENRKLWAKLDDVSTKLEAALADNDGLRARLQGIGNILCHRNCLFNIIQHALLNWERVYRQCQGRAG
ncbi:uncharacterized protein C8R40DRAFT_648077 [Lentinula edodes]|uniref:uncharacterized protein n=1 Tax=Lentinula edodes TaxID=5353 RepID=UPI001E8D2B49|nr:uncharacterized protein C8R40DRAFT_648077 [Lentinula edodes]KAH7870430.1 hypothetical protein C8R40DRAFT_648077 [Lentinula edodes]